MLYLLSVILSASLLLNPVSVMAGFFDEKDNSIQQNECSECKSDPVSLNPDLKDKVAAIEKRIFSNLNKNTGTNEITLFIDLSDSSFDKAVNSLIKFKNENIGWSVKGIITGSKDDLRQKQASRCVYY